MHSYGYENMIELEYRTGECPYCGAKINNKTKTKEHIIPKSQNGSSTYKNILWVCGTCNVIIKRDRKFGVKGLPNKVKTDKNKKVYIDSVQDRKDYINGIRGYIRKIIDDNSPIN